MKINTRKNGQRHLADFEADSVYLKALAEAVDLGELADVAIAKALESHPVTQYVKRLPFEPLGLYPAISGNWVPQDHDGEIPYVAWTLPMRDDTISKRLGCGICSSTKATELKVTACKRDMKDYIKAMSFHCWTLGCANCGNSTAIRMGVKAESRILAEKDLLERHTGHSWHPRHFVISPPQEWAKRMFQLPGTFKSLYKQMIELARKYGLHSGCVVTHPWRLNGDPQKGIPATKWEAGPHFHIIGYGFADTDGFRKEANSLNPGHEKDTEENEKFKWVIKLVHPDKEIRSVRQTVAYLLTHAGLCSYMRLDRDVNFCDVLDAFTPRIEKGDDYAHADMKEMTFDDWERWTMRKMKGFFHAISYYGDLRSDSLRIYDVHKEQVERLCPVCGEPMGIFNGLHDCNPEPAEYLRESRIYVRAGDLEFVRDLEKRHGGQLYMEGNTKLDFAMAVPQLSCPETQGVQEHRPKYSKEHLKDLRGHTIVYVPHPTGIGLKPVRVTLQEAQRMRLAGESL